MSTELPSLWRVGNARAALVWQQQPCTERQITDAIQQEREIGRTTVLKTVQRLEAKKLSQCALRGRPCAVSRFIGSRCRSAHIDRPLHPRRSRRLAGTACGLPVRIRETVWPRIWKRLKSICRKIGKDMEKP